METAERNLNTEVTERAGINWVVSVNWWKRVQRVLVDGHDGLHVDHPTVLLGQLLTQSRLRLRLQIP